MKQFSKNKKAFFDYEIFEKYEAGIALKGSEVKAIRAGRVNLKDSFVRITQGEAFLYNAHISCLPTTNTHFKHDETAPRKLLLHRKEINKLQGASSTKGLAIVALSLYANARNIIKLQIATAKGKKVYDKRKNIRRKDLEIEAARAIRERFLRHKNIDKNRI